jgi:uroporphyrin-III C-methyltransferase
MGDASAGAGASAGRRERAGTGAVYLVGAGPGDPELLTLRGARLLARADVVVYDRLAPSELLALAPPGAELIDAGKAPGRRGLGQEAINRLLVERAAAGATVVRLKGGDPFVFGRGGEEALACVRAGVPFEVVPGVSAALAAPACAGVPLTHRDLAASFAVVTASLAGGRMADLAGVAGAADTLVVLMAAERLEAVCGALLRAGRPATQPAVIVQWAATDRQRSVRATLADLPALAVAAGIGAPATLVVGEVASLADLLARGWADRAAPAAPGHPLGVPRTPPDPPAHPLGVPRTPPDPPGHPLGVPRTPPSLDTSSGGPAR